MWIIYLILVAVLVLIRKVNENYFITLWCKRVQTEDGSPLHEKICVLRGKYNFMGNTLDLLRMTPEKLFKYLRRNIKLSKRKSYILYFLLAPVYNITTAEDSVEVFQNTNLVEKSVVYNIVKPFLGEGLLISSNKKWFSRRRMLTPAFHFNVLQSFNDIFKDESLKLLEKLQNHTQDVLDVKNVITEFTLNNVIETAMGVKLDDLEGSAKYRETIHDIETVGVERVCTPLLVLDATFRWFGKYHKHMRDVAIAHDFSSRIIEKKRQEYMARKQEHEKLAQQGANETEKESFVPKKRYAMLDTLLDEEALGNIDHQGICDEVNTFMFEGYDTTSTCLIFTFLMLALHPDVQEKCRQEIENMGDFSNLSVFDFNKLEYLECVLKEVLRLFPSVPFIARSCVEETRINGFIFPAFTQVNVHTYDIMRDPRHFPDPDAFKPERFLPENSVNRHPFAFVPFSAGPRNCIGQKFATLEMKAAMVAILKHFNILPVTRLEDVELGNGIVLRAKQRIYVKLRKVMQ